MIKKIVHTADLHIYNKQFENLNSFKEKYKIFLNEINQEFVQVISGDFFHRKMDTDVSELLKGYEFLKEISSYSDVIIIVGNHDYNTRNPHLGDMISLLTSYFDLPNVIFYKNSGVYNYKNLNFYVYSDIDKHIFSESEIKNSYDTKCFNIGLYHDNLTQAVNFDGRTITKSRDVQIFNGLDAVMMGHIHKRQEIPFKTGKAVYCGSPYQQHIGESVNDHGIAFWDVEHKTYEFVDMNIPYNFISVDYNQSSDSFIIKNK